MPKAHALSQGAVPEASTPFVKQLSARLHAADLDEDAHSVQSSNRCTTSSKFMADVRSHAICVVVVSSTRCKRVLLVRSMNGPGGHMVDVELPFELRVLEAALDLAGKCFGEEVAALEKLGMPMLDSIAKRVSSEPINNNEGSLFVERVLGGGKLT